MGGNNAIKQYLRWAPAQIGLINKGAFLHQINKILPEDIFICSFPKSGNTWIRFIIANLLTQDEITFKNIDQYVSDVYTSKNLINAKKESRYIKTHDTLFKWYPKTIYIYRDFRDVLVSYYFYQTALKKFDGSIDEFISSSALNHPFGTWENHVSEALNFKNDNPDKVLLISYEEMLKNTAFIIKEIINFCDLQPLSTIKEVILKSDFDYLKKVEKENQGNFKNLTGNSFFREGKVGDWKNHLYEKEINLLSKNQKLINLMHQLGYKI